MSRQKDEVTVSEPFKRSESKTAPFYVNVQYRKPGSTGKRAHTTICTGESDRRKAMEARDRIRDEFRSKLYEEKPPG